MLLIEAWLVRSVVLDEATLNRFSGFRPTLILLASRVISGEAEVAVSSTDESTVAFLGVVIRPGRLASNPAKPLVVPVDEDASVDVSVAIEASDVTSTDDSVTTSLTAPGRLPPKRPGNNPLLLEVFVAVSLATPSEA